MLNLINVDAQTGLLKEILKKLTCLKKAVSFIENKLCN